jgi:hypothetical protein
MTEVVVTSLDQVPTGRYFVPFDKVYAGAPVGHRWPVYRMTGDGTVMALVEGGGEQRDDSPFNAALYEFRVLKSEAEKIDG